MHFLFQKELINYFKYLNGPHPYTQLDSKQDVLRALKSGTALWVNPPHPPATPQVMAVPRLAVQTDSGPKDSSLDWFSPQALTSNFSPCGQSEGPHNDYFQKS